MLTVTADCWQEEFHSENCWKTADWVDRYVVETTDYQNCYQTLDCYLKAVECFEVAECSEAVEWVESCCRRTAGCFAV